MVQAAQLVEALLHRVRREVVNDAEVYLALHNAVLRVEDHLLNHLSRREVEHLFANLVACVVVLLEHIVAESLLVLELSLALLILGHLLSHDVVELLDLAD